MHPTEGLSVWKSLLLLSAGGLSCFVWSSARYEQQTLEPFCVRTGRFHRDQRKYGQDPHISPPPPPSPCIVPIRRVAHGEGALHPVEQVGALCRSLPAPMPVSEVAGFGSCFKILLGTEKRVPTLASGRSFWWHAWCGMRDAACIWVPPSLPTGRRNSSR